MGDAPEGVDRLLGLVCQRREALDDLLRAFLSGDRASDAELDLEGHDLLLGAVVQVALEAVPLGVLRGDQPTPRRSELGRPRLELAVQAEVAQERAGGGGDIRQQAQLNLLEFKHQPILGCPFGLRVFAEDAKP